jgi:EAL domain-containing protein (putative c-di-GMP-specific phosphodiesterase class I)/GGDEF domain-containing protein
MTREAEPPKVGLEALGTLSAEAIQEVEIGYTEQSLVEKLHGYDLKPKTVLAKLIVNKNALEITERSEKAQINSFLFQLGFKLKNWPVISNLKDFTANINQLVFLWLNAIQDGASTQTILNLLNSFEIKSTFGNADTSKVRCFLFNLVAETTQQHQQLQLNFALNFDANTQLPNANQILNGLETAIKNASEGQLIGFFSMHFQVAKNNPIFSHIITMSLSKKITLILQQHIPQDYQLYYSGNLQFDVLIPHLKSDIQLNLLAAKLMRAFEQLLFLGNQSVLVTPFVGCAFFTPASGKAFDLFNYAKLALENALTKQQHFVMYSDSLQVQLSEQNELENKVIEAFSSDSLTLFFQPIVDLATTKCVGAELLLRWSEKTGYSVYPSLTVEILNKVGKGKLFTRWLINSACRYSSELLRDHDLNVYLTINLRAEDLYDVELPHMLMQALALWKISPKDIILEITENGVLENTDITSAVIKELAESGFRLALDDFGTGFSSLSRLRNMPIDLIKIDQSFVRDIKHSKDDFAIVKSIAMLANSLGKEVLAEGVEDKECLDLIKKMKIHKCQGYYFAKPMPFEKFILWAKAH